MKKGLIIGGAVILVLLLIALWVYVMFFGTPREIPEVFDGFGGSGGTPVEIEAPTLPTSTPSVVVNQNRPPLRQLTTRPVVGYREVVVGGSASPQLYYAEAGTGHIYSIDTLTGTETRRSGTTITEASAAAFSADGQTVVIKSGYGRGAKTLIGTFGSSSDAITTVTVGDEIDQFTVVGTSTLLYTVKGSVLSGKTLDLKTRATRTIFTLPFREATVAWGSSADDMHIAYPKPSYLLMGYVYGVRGGVVTRLPMSGFGLSAFQSGDMIGVGWISNNEYTTTFYNKATREYQPSSATFLPEKCTGSTLNPSRMVCTSFQTNTSFGFPDTWHRGEITLNDTISVLNFTPTTTSLQNVSTIAAESGRTVDAVSLKSGINDSAVYFTNRIDNSLWVYEFSR